MSRSQQVEVDPKLAILIVSANLDPAKFLENSLKANGFRNVRQTDSGIEAFEVLKHQGAELVIADLEVKFIDGWRLIKEIKNSDKIPNIPCLLVGSRDCKVPAKELNDYGIQNFVKLPVVPKSFMEQLFAAVHQSASERKFTEAKSNLIADKPEEAIPLYKEIESRWHRTNRSVIGLAQAFVANQELSEARSTIKFVEGLEYSAVELQIRTAIAEHDRQNAQKLIQLLVKESSVPSLIYLKIAHMLHDLQEFEFLEALIDKACQQDSGVAPFWIYKLKCLLKREDFEGMNDIFKVQKFTDSIDVLNLNATMLKRTGRVQEARDCFQKAVGISPRNTRLLYNLAMCELELGHLEEGEALLRTCVKYQPEFKLASDQLAKMRKE